MDNRTVLHLMEALQFLQLGGERQRLSFRALGIEQIGHVYEGLLDHTVFRAPEDATVLGLLGAKGQEPEVVLTPLTAGREVVVSRDEVELGRAGTAFKGPGARDLEFANVDNRLTLLVDGVPVFGDGLSYEDNPEAPPEPTFEDLSPVRIASKGADLTVSRLVLKRDIYYTQNPGYLDYGNAWDSRMPRTAAELFDLLADPPRVAELGPLNWTDYEIGEDRFLMLGDNSPRSKDSRGWSSGDIEWDTTGRKRWEVPGSMIVGKAFGIYWPHAKPFGPDVRVSPDFRVPFRPYFERMGLIR